MRAKTMNLSFEDNFELTYLSDVAKPPGVFYGLHDGKKPNEEPQIGYFQSSKCKHFKLDIL